MFKLTSSAFASGTAVPDKYTCKGEDISPPLEWSGAPDKVATYAIVMDDPDAPSGTWVHWLIWNFPPSGSSMSADTPRLRNFDDGGRQGRNSFGKIGYNGPCPPPGQTHRYFFRIYALDQKLDLQAGATRAQLDAAMKGHVLAQSEYMGTFHR